MKKLNNKGFAISTILFSVLMIFISVSIITISTIASNPDKNPGIKCPNGCNNDNCVCPPTPNEVLTERCPNEFKIGTEHFCPLYIGNDYIVALAKYNLNVGYDIIMVKGTYGIPTQTKTSIQNLDGVKQDSDFSGCESSDSSCKASLFSSDYYWMDNGPRKLKDQYSNNGAYSHSNENDMFFDSNGQVYPYVYDSNSEIYSYINGENGYLDYLKSLGAPSSITGRLMTIDEALISGCVLNESGNNPCTGWITETQFYLGSAISGSASLEISNSAINRTYTVLGSSSNINAGVRPVIEVETSYIK